MVLFYFRPPFCLSADHQYCCCRCNSYHCAVAAALAAAIATATMALPLLLLPLLLLPSYLRCVLSLSNRRDCFNGDL